MIDRVREIDHVSEIDHVIDQVDQIEEKVDLDHVTEVTEDEKEVIHVTEVILEDMTEDEVDPQEDEDDRDHHLHHIEVVEVADAADLVVVEAVDVEVTGMTEVDEKKEIIGGEMILMDLMANQNPLGMMIYLLMDSLLHPVVIPVKITIVAVAEVGVKLGIKEQIIITNNHVA